MLTVEEARKKILEGAQSVADTEEMVLLYAAGRLLAEPVISGMQVPAWDNSQMDGYALNSDDLKTVDSTLKVSGVVYAGHAAAALEPGTCQRIFTGAPMPKGADAVVPQENTELLADGSVKFHEVPQKGAWVRKAGCDIQAGDVVLAKGTRLTPAALGAAASVGVGSVMVYKPIRVALFFTGDELAMPGESLSEGGIYNSNRFVLRGLLRQLGCEVQDYGNIPDSLEATMAVFEKAQKNSELIITSGGMSVGDKDFIRPAVEKLGQLDMWRIAVKPGKPVAKGRVGKTLFIGLPGNPVSGLVTFLLFARPLILRLSGASTSDVRGYMLPLDFDWKGGSRREFIRVRRNAAGALEGYRTQNSAVLSSCVWADGLADIPAGADLKKGDLVLYTPFSAFEPN